MSIFTKALFFFLIPTILFSVFAVPTLRKNSPRAVGEAWMPFASSGATLSVPATLTLQDPLTAGTELLEHRWAMPWPPKSVSAAYLRAKGNAFQAFLFAGPAPVLDPLVTQALGAYRESRMVERDAPRVWTAGDGLVFHVEGVRYLPGSVAGEDSALVFGWATRNGTTVVFHAGGRAERMQIDTLKALVESLRLPK